MGVLLFFIYLFIYLFIFGVQIPQVGSLARIPSIN
jgi:hypothetical protein